MNTKELFGQLDKLFSENRISEVEKYLTQALSEAEYDGDLEAERAIYNELISFHRSTGEYDKSLYFCRQVIKLAKKMEIEDTVPYGTTLMNVANTNRAMGNLLESLAYFKQVRSIYQGQVSPDDILMATYYNNIALLYQDLGEYDKAVDSFEQALAIIERHDKASSEIAATYVNLGESLLRLGRLEDAREKLVNAVHRYQIMGERGYHYSAALAAVAETWYRQGDMEQALKYYELAAESIYGIYGDNDTYRVIMGNIETVKSKLNS